MIAWEEIGVRFTAFPQTRPMSWNKLFVYGALLFVMINAYAQAASLADTLAVIAPNANPEVIRLALSAVECASRSGQGVADRVTIIDYSKPSTERRLWVFDLSRKTLLYNELVAHGRDSGDNFASTFSNQPGSKKSSLGLFRTATTYQGKNGYTLQLHGLEAQFNDNALNRTIVMHGANYVSSGSIKALGRLGRSWGCPAVRLEIAKELIDNIKENRFIFIYYPDREWLQSSTYLHCAK
jgi:L,D-transpeptidase catalytic domain